MDAKVFLKIILLSMEACIDLIAKAVKLFEFPTASEPFIQRRKKNCDNAFHLSTRS